MRRSKTATISSLLADFIKEQGLADGLFRARVYKAYNEAVGSVAASSTTEKFYKDKVLYCKISSSLLRFELFKSNNRIRERINEILGVKAVDKIVLR